MFRDHLGLRGEGRHVDELAVQLHLQLRRLRTDTRAGGLQPQRVLPRDRQLQLDGSVRFIHAPRGRRVPFIRPTAQRQQIDGNLLRARLVVVQNGRAHHFLRRREVSLKKHRRQRKDVADIVKPVARIIRREIVRRLKLHAHQVADRVVVFRTVQPPERHATGVGVVRVRRENIRLNPLHQLLPLVDGWLLCLIIRRHRARAEILQHGVPHFEVIRRSLRRRVSIEHDVALLLRGRVAAETIRVQQRADFLLKIRRASRTGDE